MHMVFMGEIVVFWCFIIWKHEWLPFASRAEILYQYQRMFWLFLGCWAVEKNWQSELTDAISDISCFFSISFVIFIRCVVWYRCCVVLCCWTNPCFVLFYFILICYVKNPYSFVNIKSAMLLLFLICVLLCPVNFCWWK